MIAATSSRPNRLTIAVAAWMAFTTCSCVNDAFLAVVPDDAGDAAADATNNDLSLDGEFEAQNTMDGASVGVDFETRVLMHLSSQGTDVVNASVVVHTSAGDVPLTLSGVVYVGTLHGYDGDYTVDIVTPTKTLMGVAITGLPLHHFSSPYSNGTYRANTALGVAWSPSGAQSATIESDQLRETSIADTGTYTLSPDDLVGEPGHVEPDEVRVTRRSHVLVPAISPTSSVTFEVRNEVSFLVDAQ